MKVVAAGARDVGLARENNEDAFAVVLPPNLAPGLDALVVIADGLSGHAAGEAATSTADEPGAAVRAPIALALACGGPDNVTVVVGKIMG